MAARDLAKAKIIAHGDGNNFYASCEGNFDSSLRGRPLIVLSNNDGCVVARSQEAKDLGIKMGQPLFQIKDFILKHKVVLRSSNYALYDNMSRRFHRILRDFSPVQEVYSIDESFLDMTGFDTHNLYDIGQEMRRRCRQWIGLPICVGFGYSKTEAKLADFLAKKRPHFNGVCDLTSMSDEEIDAIYASVDVGEVWGIGSRLAAKLNGLGIHNVLQLKRTDPEFMRQQYSVVLEKTVRELNHVSCMALEEIAPAKKSIMSAKGFGTAVTSLVELQQALTQYIGEATEKLRRDKSLAKTLQLFVMTSQHLPDVERYHAGTRFPLPSPTDDTLQITNIALWALKQLYKPGYRYQKVGVMLDDLVPREGGQEDLFAWKAPSSKSTKLMTVMDAVNTKYGRGTVRPASQGFSTRWEMRREMMSRHFTTRWDELPVIRI